MHVRLVRNTFLFPHPQSDTAVFPNRSKHLSRDLRYERAEGDVCAAKHTRQDYKRKFLLEQKDILMTGKKMFYSEVKR